MTSHNNIKTMLSKKIKQELLQAQKNEITEHYIYLKLSLKIKDPDNRQVLVDIAEDELKHYNIWKKYTETKVKPSKWKIFKYYVISRVLGLTFGVRLMEKGEKNAQIVYEEISKEVPEAKNIKHEEEKHEQELIELLNEEKLTYIGSVVLGLNDALVELTGALAGFTFALQNTRLIAVTGLITGIAASLSMAVSEYLSTKSEGDSETNPLKASVYTGIAYVFTVIFLIFPYLIFSNIYLALGITLLNAILVILFFTFYISVAKNLPFRKRFLEMAGLSLGVAVITFGIGFLIRTFFEIEI